MSPPSGRTRLRHLTTWLPASPGAASGIAVFDAGRAEMLGKEHGFKVIQVREETKPEDIHGFFASEGLLTSRGGKTSHAAVVARGIGKCCAAGAEGIRIDVEKRIASVGDPSVKEGDMITLDGTSGKVYLGEIPTVEPEFIEELGTLLTWADELAFSTPADRPGGAAAAGRLGSLAVPSWGSAIPGSGPRSPAVLVRCRDHSDPARPR